MFSFLESFFKKEPSSEPAIGWDLAKAYNKTRTGKKHTAFCYAPSSNLLFSQSGSVYVCCHNLEFPIGKYPEQTIKEIWNSAKANELREYMRQYDLSHGCGICESDLKRQSFREVRANHFDSFPKHPRYPTMMEFLVSNQCNLECVMCKGEYSSLIRKNRDKLPPLVTPYDKEFLRQLEEFIPYLHETRFSGSGEAFSIDMNYEIWEMIVKRNPKCTIMVQTNGTILTERVKDIMGRGNFLMGVSLDSLKKEVYEEIRLNANFEKVMENIRFFSEYSRKRKKDFRVAMCVMRQNWRELPDFVNFCNSMDANATFHQVWYPREYTLQNLKYEELRKIYDYLSAHDFSVQTPQQALNRSHYKYIVSVIKEWMDARWKMEEGQRQRIEAGQRQIDERVENAKRLPREDLLPFLREDFKRMAAIANSGVDEQALTDAMQRLTSVIGMYKDEREQEQALRKMCAVPIEYVFAALKGQPPEALFSQAKNWLDEDAFKNVLDFLSQQSRKRALEMTSPI